MFQYLGTRRNLFILFLFTTIVQTYCLQLYLFFQTKTTIISLQKDLDQLDDEELYCSLVGMSNDTTAMLMEVDGTGDEYSWGTEKDCYNNEIMMMTANDVVDSAVICGAPQKQEERGASTDFSGMMFGGKHETLQLNHRYLLHFYFLWRNARGLFSCRDLWSLSFARRDAIVFVSWWCIYRRRRGNYVRPFPYGHKERLRKRNKLVLFALFI